MDLKQARNRLELILNSEIVGAKNGYDSIVEKYIELSVSKFSLLTNTEPDEETKRLIEYFKDMRTKKEKELRADINKVRKDQIQGENRIVLRTTEPYFIAKGSHQVVIDIGNDLVAKLRYEKKFCSDEYLSVSWDYDFLKDTADTLRSIGLQVPELEFLRAEWNDNKIEVSNNVSNDSYRRYLVQSQRFIKRTRKKPVYCVDALMPKNLPNVCIMNDLREGGRYQVFDFEEEIVKSLSNGEDIIREYERNFSQLMNIYNKKRFYLKPDSEPFIEFDPHKSSSPKEAIKRMFLLQAPTNKKDLGKLVMGDLDHIKVFR